MRSENFQLVKQRVDALAEMGPFVGTDAMSRLIEDLKRLKKRGAYLKMVEGKGLGLVAGPTGIQPGPLGKLWGTLEIVPKDELGSAPAGNRTVQRGTRLAVEGQGLHVVRVHGARACGVSFINSSNEQEGHNAQIVTSEGSKWKSSFLPLCMDLPDVEPTLTGRSNVLNRLIADFTEQAGTLWVKVVSYIPPGEEVLLWYPLGLPLKPELVKNDLETPNEDIISLVRNSCPELALD